MRIQNSSTLGHINISTYIHNNSLVYLPLHLYSSKSLHEFFNILSLSDSNVINQFKLYFSYNEKKKQSQPMMITCINGANVVSIFVLVYMFWAGGLYSLNKICHLSLSFAYAI